MEHIKTLASWTAAMAVIAAMAGCASPRDAVPQTASIDGKSLTFGGTFEPRNTSLTLTVNGEPVLRGNFPPFTPTLNLSGDFHGSTLRSECYFASVLNDKAGMVGKIASVVQGSTGKSSDVCKMFANGKEAATLNF